jgi:signal transduction histidine kinase
MKRPWQIWTVFGLCLAVVLAGMAWLSARAIELDRAEADAREQAESGQRALAKENLRVELQRMETEREKLQTQLEKNIGQALWRMDSFMIPLLAQESFLPHAVYEPFYEVPLDPAVEQTAADPPADNEPQRNNSSARESQRQPSQAQLVRWVPSPLLVNRSPYVKLHFQFDAEGKLSSPQAPDEKFHAACADNGIGPEQLEASRRRLEEFRQRDVFAQLASGLPKNHLHDTLLPQELAYNLAQPQQAQAAGYVREGEVAQNSAGNYRPIDRQMSGKNRGDFNYRNTAKNQYELNEWARQQIATHWKKEIQARNPRDQVAEQPIREGASEPMWIGETLVLARRVEVRDAELIQGLEFDWPLLERDLLADVADLLPQASLEPVKDVDEANEGRMLATLPVKLVVPPLSEQAPPIRAIEVAELSEVAAVSPIWATLGVAWSGVLLASLAVGGLLLGVVRLSERRASFVSSVTHELRTPLTTFRMYAEMLAEGMVTSDEQRRAYLQTLTTEADRLTHLVENVLTYSRIEQGRGIAKRRRTTLGEILDHCQPRLIARAEHADMKLTIDRQPAEAARIVETDVSAVEQILFNLVDNACKYAQTASDRRIQISFAGNPRRPEIVVHDHGPGLSREAARRLFQPFSKSADEAAHSAPGVGLGLALSRRLARSLGGDLFWQAAADGGAQFTLSLPAGSK